MNFRESQSLYTEVTKESLDNIPHVNYFSAELNEKYRQVNSLLLKEVQKHDVGVEISAICNDKMELIGGFTVGTYGSVKIPDSNDIYYAFHNHPSGETFSPEDLMNFIKRKNMLSLTAQGNNGKGNYCILKTPESDSMGYSNFLNSKTEECIYFFENQKYSYAMMKKGELDLSLLNDKQIFELQDIIKNFGEECARGSEKFGYKYFKGTT